LTCRMHPPHTSVSGARRSPVIREGLSHWANFNSGSGRSQTGGESTHPVASAQTAGKKRFEAYPLKPPGMPKTEDIARVQETRPTGEVASPPDPRSHTRVGEDLSNRPRVQKFLAQLPAAEAAAISCVGSSAALSLHLPPQVDVVRDVPHPT
jgi:hypothetical protein